MHIPKIHVTPETIAFFLTALVVFTGVFSPVWFQWQRATPDTVYKFAGGYYPDYYQYLGWIRDGMERNLLLATRYTELPYPKVLIHIFFPIAGIIGGLFTRDSAIVYLASRILMTIVFLIAVWAAVRNTLPKTRTRILALALFVTATSTWRLDGAGNLIEPASWVTTFNVIGKFIIPPHHLSALAAMIVSILCVSSRKPAYIVVTITATLLTGFLNPSILLFLLTVYIGMAAAELLLYRKPAGRLLHYGFLIAISSAVLLYHEYIFRTTDPWRVMYELMKAFRVPVTTWEYVLAMGPTALLAPAGCVAAVIKRNERLTPYVIWFLAPFAVFVLRQYLPVNESRLFQSYQYVPMGILAAAGLEWLTIRTGKFRRHIIAVTVLVLAGFAVIPFIHTVSSQASYGSTNWFNVYLPRPLWQTLRHLDTETQQESVVVAGEFVSQMIPAFAHNRTVIGRDDTIARYYDLKQQADDLLAGTFSATDAQAFLAAHRVSYVIYGIDAVPFTADLQSRYPFLKPVYQNGGITLVEVMQ